MTRTATTTGVVALLFSRELVDGAAVVEEVDCGGRGGGVVAIAVVGLPGAGVEAAENAFFAGTLRNCSGIKYDALIFRFYRISLTSSYGKVDEATATSFLIKKKEITASFMRSYGFAVQVLFLFIFNLTSRTLLFQPIHLWDSLFVTLSSSVEQSEPKRETRK